MQDNRLITSMQEEKVKPKQQQGGGQGEPVGKEVQFGYPDMNRL